MSFSPYDDQVQADPYPHYAQLRRNAPVHRDDEDDFWALSRYHDVKTGFRDTSGYSARNGNLLDRRHFGPEASRYLSFLAMDPPRHTALRAVATAGFTPSAVQALAPRIREIVRGHWNTALEAGSFDFVTDVAVPVPCDVISELLGVPTADRAEIRRLIDLTIHRRDGARDIPPDLVDAVLKLVAYYSDLLADRADRPRDDYTSALLAAADADPGNGPTRDELVSMLFLLAGAGNETTTHLLANAWHAAWRHPDQRAAAFAGRIRDWVEETLRYDPPGQGVVRTANRDLHLHGQTIPEGERILLLIGAANHDPAVFPEPDRFDLDRDTKGALAFGLGPHFCLGAPLARLEAQITLEEITSTIAGYDLDLDTAERLRSAHVRGFLRLPTTIHRRRPSQR